MNPTPKFVVPAQYFQKIAAYRGETLPLYAQISSALDQLDNIYRLGKYPSAKAEIRNLHDVVFGCSIEAQSLELQITRVLQTLKVLFLDG